MVSQECPNCLGKMLSEHNFNSIIKPKAPTSYSLEIATIPNKFKSANNGLISSIVPPKIPSETIEEMSFALDIINKEYEHERHILLSKYQMLDPEIIWQFKLIKEHSIGLRTDSEGEAYPTNTHQSDRKILVLDLDETLIYCFKKSEKDFPNRVIKSIKVGFFNYFYIERPGLQNFLLSLSKFYSIVVCASTGIYQ